jgi:hypothetical protein
MNDSRTSHLCYYAFSGLTMKANGDYSPCCKYAHDITHHGQTLNAASHGLRNAWNADSMKALRAEFLAGKKPAGCRICWEEEAAGVQSIRLDSFHRIATEQLDRQEQPLRLELYPSNLCNLKCRICGPYNSSRWIQEARQTLGSAEVVHENLTPQNIDVFREWLPNLKELSLLGGEPLLVKEYEELLDAAIQGGYSSGITLYTNTNGTLYRDELLQRLQRFKKVYFAFSIDDIGRRFDYQRKGASWRLVTDNMRRYAEHGGFGEPDPIQYTICLTLSNLNVFYLDEFFRWLSQAFPKMRVYVNFLTDPAVFCIRTLPKELKEVVARKLEAIPSMDLDWGPETGKEKLRIVDAVARYLYEGPFLPDWLVDLNVSGFLDRIRRGDEYRRERFEEVFPELWQSISKYDQTRFRHHFQRSVLEQMVRAREVAGEKGREVAAAASTDFDAGSKAFLQERGADEFIQLYLDTVSRLVCRLERVKAEEATRFREKVSAVIRIALEKADRTRLAHHLVRADPVDVVRGLYERPLAALRQRLERMLDDSGSPSA